MALTVKSMTSGNPLLAEKIRESKVRKFFGMAHILLKVDGTALGKGRVRRLGWYSPEEITEYPDPPKAEVFNIHGVVDA